MNIQFWSLSMYVSYKIISSFNCSEFGSSMRLMIGLFKLTRCVVIKTSDWTFRCRPIFDPELKYVQAYAHFFHSFQFCRLMIIGCGYSSFASESNDDFQDASLASVAAAVPTITMNEQYKFSRKLIPMIIKAIFPNFLSICIQKINP